MKLNETFVCSLLLLLASCANNPHLLPQASLNFLSQIHPHHCYDMSKKYFKMGIKGNYIHESQPRIFRLCCVTLAVNFCLLIWDIIWNYKSNAFEQDLKLQIPCFWTRFEIPNPMLLNKIGKSSLHVVIRSICVYVHVHWTCMYNTLLPRSVMYRVIHPPWPRHFARPEGNLEIGEMYNLIHSDLRPILSANQKCRKVCSERSWS